MRIMVCEPSAVVRTILENNLSKNSDIEILASASYCNKLLKQIKDLTPDIILSGADLGDEIEKKAVKEITDELNIPVVFLCSMQDKINNATVFKKIVCLEKPNLHGYTVDFFNLLSKTLSDNAKKTEQKEKVDVVNNMMRDSIPEITIKKSRNTENSESYKVLCIGASTGGPTAVSEVLSGLGENFPLPILYAQHIDIKKDKNLAEWLDGVCSNLTVKLAEDGEKAQAGTVYMAPADKHLIVNYVNNDFSPVLKLSDEEPEHFLRPAVNKLFRSAAQKYKAGTLAILLTGMGSDGADGCKQICDNAGWTIVEDKSTCAVFGMPAAAIESGGAKEVLPRNQIAKRILELVAK